MNFRACGPEIENNMTKVTSIQLFKNIQTLVEQSKQDLYAVTNTILTETYFHIGRLIVEYEQQGSNRAGYAKTTLINLSQKLTPVLGKGFSVDNLENMRKFYTVYKDDYLKHVIKNKKSEALPRKLVNDTKSETVSRKSSSVQKSETLSRKLNLSPFRLSWSHYGLLANIENSLERKFYEIESVVENWSVRELKRQ